MDKNGWWGGGGWRGENLKEQKRQIPLTLNHEMSGLILFDLSFYQ